MSNGYTKIFSDIITSTIWQESNDCRVLWITILALKDETNVCRATVPALAKLCDISIEECEVFLKKFQLPDKYSRSQDFEGRRIEPVDGGWLVLNGQKYRDMLRGQDRRDYVRVKVAEHRARVKSEGSGVNKCNQSNQSKPIAEAEAEAEEKEESTPKPPFLPGEPKQQPRTSKKSSKAFVKPTIEEVRAFCESEGLEERDADAFFHGKDGNGWKNGSAPIKDWKATVRSWKAQGYHPSQKDSKDKPVRNCI